MARKGLRRTPTREVAEPTKRTRARAVARPTRVARVAPAPKRPVRPTPPPVRETPSGRKGTGFIPPRLPVPSGYAPTADPKDIAKAAKQMALATIRDYYAGRATKEQAMAAKQAALEAARKYYKPEIGKGPSRPRGIVGRR